jgi:hypothetical protein
MDGTAATTAWANRSCRDAMNHHGRPEPSMARTDSSEKSPGESAT